MDKSTNRALGAVVAVILVIASIVVAVGSRPVAKIDTSKAEGVVQAYLTAVMDRNFDEAATYFAADSACKAEFFTQTWVPENAQISLVSVTNSATATTVTVTADIPSGDPFGGSYQERHSFRLTPSGPTWRLAGSPWPLYDCGAMK
jgi:Tfp pilus assembly protein PilE